MVLKTRRSPTVRCGSRYEPSGSTLTVLLPPTVCAAVICRVIGDAALRVEVAGEADVVATAVM